MDLIDKDDGKTQWRSIYEVINDMFFDKYDYFTNEFLQKCKHNANILLLQKKWLSKADYIHRL